MELETTDMNLMDFINLNTNEILITVIDAQGKRKDYQMNKISKVKELSQSYLADTNQLGKAEAVFNLKGRKLDNDKTFAEQNISDGETLHVIISIRKKVSIFIKDTNGSTIPIEVQLNQTLTDLFPNEVGNIRFVLGPKNIPTNQTFEQLGITDNDIIQKTTNLLGGIIIFI